MPDGGHDVAQEFADLFAQPQEVKIGRHRFMVRELSLSEYGAISKAVRVAIMAMQMDDGSEAFVAAHIEDLVGFIAAATDLDRALIARFPGRVQLALYAACVEVNRDFFARSVSFRIGKLAGEVKAMIGGAGSLPSTSSETEDIPSASRTHRDASDDS